MREKVTITIWKAGEFQVHEDGRTATNYRFDHANFESLKSFFCKFGYISVIIKEDRGVHTNYCLKQTGIEAGSKLVGRFDHVYSEHEHYFRKQKPQGLCDFDTQEGDSINE